MYYSFLLCEIKNSLSDAPSKHSLFSKTSSRRLEDVFSVTLFVFQDTYLRYVFLKRLPDVFAVRLAIMSSIRLQDVFKTSWKTKKCYLKTSSRRLQDVFSTSSPRQIIAGLILKKCIFIYLYCRFFKFHYTIKIIVRFYPSECSIYLPLLSQIKVNNTLL